MSDKSNPMEGLAEIGEQRQGIRHAPAASELPAPDGSADLHPRTLDAKWLDPQCWDGCQSLILKNKGERYEKLLLRVLEWCEQESPEFEIDADAIRTALNPPNNKVSEPPQT